MYRIKNAFSNCTVNCEKCKDCSQWVCEKLSNKLSALVEKLTSLLERIPQCTHFLICIPLKTGIVMVVVFCLIYGVIGLVMFFKIIINYSAYEELYKKKMDVLVYLIYQFLIISITLFSSIILFVGFLRYSDMLLVIFSWSIVVHLILNWISTLIVSCYCVVNSDCFQGSGMGQAIGGIIIAVAYTIIWCYFLVFCNSYRQVMDDLDTSDHRVRDLVTGPIVRFHDYIDNYIRHNRY